MTPTEFADRAQRTIGPGWQSRLCRAIGKDASTVRRWVSGSVPVPDYAVALVELLEVTPTAFRPGRWIKGWARPE